MQAVERARKLLDEETDQSMSYNDKVFKRVYRAHKDQIAKTVIFDISQPVIEEEDYESTIYNQVEPVFTGVSNPNPFTGISSISYINSSLENPEDMEMYIAVQTGPIQNQTITPHVGGRVIENPEDDYFYHTHPE